MRITQDNKLRVEPSIDDYCVLLLRRIQEDKCLCGKELKGGFQIAHKRYGEDITLYDLELKCGVCHAKEHGIRKHTGTLRTI